MNRLLHIPEGFRDIYREENRDRRILRKKLNDLLESFGYQGIETPGVEYFDVFGKDIGTTPSRELYKFFDRDGNTIVLRSDFTPAVARAASTYFYEEDRPLRLFYDGNVYQNNVLNQGRLRETSQIGAELIGDGSIDADAEMLTLVVRMFEEAGLKDFQISVNHSDIFEALLREAKFEEEEEEEIRNLILNRNFFGLEETLMKKDMEEDLRSLFSLLGPQYEPMDNWGVFLEASKNYERVRSDLEYLKKLHEVLCLYGVDSHISFDLGQISSLTYYTGIIFTGYTFGTGEAIVKGGRYDHLLSNFGKEAPAIGFAFIIDQLMMALERQKILIPDDLKRYVLVYETKDRMKAIEKATELRNEGASCEMISTENLKDTVQKLKGALENEIIITSSGESFA